MKKILEVIQCRDGGLRFNTDLDVQDDMIKEVAEKAKKAFENANSQVTGVIINKASLRGSGYHGYYASSYYND